MEFLARLPCAVLKIKTAKERNDTRDTKLSQLQAKGGKGKSEGKISL